MPGSRRLGALLLTLVFLVTAGRGEAALPDGISIAPAPAWVEALPEVAPAKPDDGIAYRVVDAQVSLLGGVPVEYSAFAFDVTDRSGLEGAGRWTIRFQPDFQRVQLHRLRVLRDGVVLDRRETARVELLRSEDRAGSGIYDGWRQAELLIPDIQVGDRIELAYSIAGDNPVFAGLFHRSYQAAYSQAAGLRRVRLLAPRDRPLAWRQSGPVAYEAEEIEGLDHQEVVLTARPLPEVASESGVPSWFDGYGKIELSNAQGWDEVSQWAARLFAFDDPGQALERTAAELGLDGAGASEALARALSFVQTEVRYVSLSIGESSHTPASPATTLDRRYGDCKDKSLLLIGLLAQAGVKSEPVLVDTNLRHEVANGLAGPNAFDHAIVRARIDGQWVYVDPTRNPEVGKPSDRAPVRFGKGLPVAAGASTALVDIAAAPLETPAVEVRTEWKLLEPDDERRLAVTVHTDYRFDEANRLRARFQSDGAAEIGRGYVDYMRGLHDDIEADGDPQATDDPDNNLFSVTERYLLPLPPDEDEPGALGELNLGLFQIGDWLPGFRDIERKWPLALTGPSRGRQVLRMPMAGGWDVAASEDEVANAFFRFRRQVAVEGNTLVITGDWERLADWIPAEDYAAVRSDLRRVNELIDYGVSLGGSGATGREASMRDLAWPALALLATVLVLVGAWFARERNSLAGMLYRPRLTIAGLAGGRGYVRAGVLVLLANLAGLGLELIPPLVAGHDPDTGMALLLWLAYVPQVLFFTGVMLLVLRLMGVRVSFGRLWIATGWGLVPSVLLGPLALLASWPVLGALADPAVMPGGELGPRLAMALVGVGLVLLSAGWSLVTVVAAEAEASGAGIGRTVGACAIVTAIYFVLVLFVIIALVATGAMPLSALA